MWKYRESFISPRTYFDIDKEESALFDDHEVVGVKSSRSTESATRITLAFAPTNRETTVDVSAKVQQSAELSESVIATLYSDLKLLNGRVAPHTYEDSTRNAKSPFWWSMFVRCGFAPGYIDPEHIHLKFRWRPAKTGVFEHGLLAGGVSSDYIKDTSKYATLSASYIHKVQKSWFIGIMAKIGLAPLTTSGKLSSSERRPAVNVDPVVKIGTLYQWEEQKVNVKANVAITKHLQKDIEAKVVADKVIDGAFVIPFFYASYKNGIPSPSKLGVGVKLNIGDDW